MPANNREITQSMFNDKNKFDEIYFIELEAKSYEFKETIKYFKYALKNSEKPAIFMILKSVQLDFEIYSEENKPKVKIEVSKLLKKLKQLKRQNDNKEKLKNNTKINQIINDTI